MDKNTLIGALLIGAVLIGFTWFSKPDPTQQTPPPADTTHVVAQQPAAPQATADTAALDSTGAPILAPYQQAKEVVPLSKPYSQTTSTSQRSPYISSVRATRVWTSPCARSTTVW